MARFSVLLAAVVVNLAGASRLSTTRLRGGWLSRSTTLSVDDAPTDAPTGAPTDALLDAPPLVAAPPRRRFSPTASQVGMTAGLALGWAVVKRHTEEVQLMKPRTAEAWRKMNKRKRAIIPLSERAPAIAAVAVACGLALDYCAQARVHGMRDAFAHTDLGFVVGGTWSFAATQAARAMSVPQALLLRARGRPMPPMPDGVAVLESYGLNAAYDEPRPHRG